MFSKCASLSKHLLFVFLFALLNNCELPPPKVDQEATPTLQVLDEIKIKLAQPIVFRENILSERGIDNLDSLSWQQLQLHQLESYQKQKAYFLSGQVSTGNPNYRTILILADHPASSEAWLVNYNQQGTLIDQMLVYHKDLDNHFKVYGSLRAGILKITMHQAEKELPGTFQINEEGKFQKKNL